MSSGGGAGPLVPTFHGFVHNSMDGLILFEACLSGKLHHVPRRPHDRERSSLIKSGSIFIYEENASGIKRWTDGVAWSPSRILGNFLIYRELEKPFPPGEKKRAMKRKRTSLPGEPYPRRDSDDNDASELTTPLTPPEQNGGDVKSELPSTDQDKELERSLIGSLVDSYGFRPDGLVKKTMSISVNGISHHMVSYYKVDDVKNQLLPRPMSDHRLSNISVRPELYLKQNFRAPVEETEHYAFEGHMSAHPQMIYSAVQGNAYGMRPGQVFGQQHYPGMYGLATSSSASVYGGMTGTAWPSQPASAGAIPYGGHGGYAGQPYGAYYKSSSDASGASAIKSESQSATTPSMQYGNQYTPSYPAVQRSNSQSAPSMMHSNYQTPVQPASSTFGSMSTNTGRPSYGGNAMHSPTTDGQQQQQQQQPVYGNGSTQSYAVRSPSQPYNMHSQAQSSVAQSPHPSVKSPQSAHPGTPAQGTSADPNAQLHNPPMPYRSNSYAVPQTPQSAHPATDLNGLGISTSSAYSAPSQSGQSYNYGSSTQAYRSVGHVGAGAQNAGQYAA